MCAWRPEVDTMFLSITFLSSLRQGFSLNLEFTNTARLVTSNLGLPVCLLSAGLLHGCQGSKLRPSCFCGWQSATFPRPSPGISLRVSILVCTNMECAAHPSKVIPVLNCGRQKRSPRPALQIQMHMELKGWERATALASPTSVGPGRW